MPSPSPAGKILNVLRQIEPPGSLTSEDIKLVETCLDLKV